MILIDPIVELPLINNLNIGKCYFIPGNMSFYIPNSDDELWALKKAIAYKTAWILGKNTYWYYKELVDACLPDMYIDKNNKLRSPELKGTLGSVGKLEFDKKRQILYLNQTCHSGNIGILEQIIATSQPQNLNINEKINILKTWDKCLSIIGFVKTNASNYFCKFSLDIMLKLIDNDLKEIYQKGLQNVFMQIKEPKQKNTAITFETFKNTAKFLEKEFCYENYVNNNWAILLFIRDNFLYGEKTAKNNFLLWWDKEKQKRSLYMEQNYSFSI